MVSCNWCLIYMSAFVSRTLNSCWRLSVFAQWQNNISFSMRSTVTEVTSSIDSRAPIFLPLVSWHSSSICCCYKAIHIYVDDIEACKRFRRIESRSPESDWYWLFVRVTSIEGEPRRGQANALYKDTLKIAQGHIQRQLNNLALASRMTRGTIHEIYVIVAFS